MHWLPIVVICALTYVGQTILAPRIELAGARPDFLLILVVFFALSGSPRRGVLIGWGVGFFADLLSVERMGLLSLSYGLTALTLVSIREYLFQRGPITQVLVTLIFALAIRAGWTVYVRVLYGGSAGSPRELLITSLYTAVLAPVACGLLGRVAPVFGMPRRLSDASRSSLGFSHV